ncbi:MAG: ABC transporter ATP-binding protein [Verrucomicrobiota bacterium]|nr:ABC transporter ATP-binding protein [Verrucomicrobiota bacterium]
MIPKIELCLKHRLKVKRKGTFHFKPGINVLIGPNGSGKSTVLRALHSCDECRIKTPDGAPTLYFNPETMNPHHPDYYPSDVREMILKTRGIFSSHGEILRAVLFSLPIREGSVFLVDEPETGQDIAGVQRIREGFDKIVASGGQIIAASHHPFFLQNAHLIELTPGYAEELHQTYLSLQYQDTRHKTPTN